MTDYVNLNEITTKDRIPFNFTYFAMKLLGRNLYSNPWTAISEIVANGIDAKARVVYVLVDMRNKETASIEIFDNGEGMSYHDLCDKYTIVGRNKRDSQDNIKGKTLGRKGIGKLAALYLSPKYYLLTKTKKDTSGWVVDTLGISDKEIPTLNRVINLNQIIIAKEEWDLCETGTMIHLTNVDLSNIGYERLKGLYAILTDYYLPDCIASTIKVCVLNSNNDSIKFQALKKEISFGSMCAIFDNSGKEYAKLLNDSVYVIAKEGVPEIDEIKEPTQVLDVSKFSTEGKITLIDINNNKFDADYNLTGWIGIHASLNSEIIERNTITKKIQNHPNALRLYVRGKLAVSNLMSYLNFSQAFANYIEGEISFDILDDDRFIDASTSNREGYSLADPRVKALIEITKKIITSLFKIRVDIGSNSNKKRDAFYEKLRKQEEQKKQEEERKRIAAEERARQELIARKDAERNADTAREAKESAERKLKATSAELDSETSRNVFLSDALTEDQISYTQKLHMIKINNGSIKNEVDFLVLKKKNNELSVEDAWDGIKNISYCNSRIKAVLDYCAQATFNTKDETVCGDLFEFIYEYCNKISQKICLAEGTRITISICKSMDRFVTTFTPQNIGVLIDNVISNSSKNGAKNIEFKLYTNKIHWYIDIIDDGNGLKNDVDIEKIFEFGKSYTGGTGIGLYHVKQVVDEMNGKITVIGLTKGFGLQIEL